MVDMNFELIEKKYYQINILDPYNDEKKTARILGDYVEEFVEEIREEGENSFNATYREKLVEKYYEAKGFDVWNLSPSEKVEIDKEVAKSLIVAGFQKIDLKSDSLITHKTIGHEFGKGVPDLLCARGNRVLFVEVKSDGDGLRESQIEWMAEKDVDLKVAFVKSFRGMHVEKQVNG